MEPQVDICFKKDKKRRCCMDIAIFILVIFIAFVIGLIVIIGFLFNFGGAFSCKKLLSTLKHYYKPTKPYKCTYGKQKKSEKRY